MLDTTLTVAGRLIGFVPYAVMSFIPFMRALRISKPRLALLLITVAVALLAVGQAGVPTGNTIWDYLSYAALIGALMLIAVGVYMYAIDASSPRKLFVLMICCDYAGLVTGFANYLSYMVFTNASSLTGGWEYITMQAAVLLVSAPLFILFLIKQVKPALSYTRSQSWNILWFIPAMFFVSIMMLAMPVSGAALSSYTFPATLVTLTLGLFTALMVIMNMLNMSEQALRLERDVSIADRQLELQADQYKHLQQRIEEARKARHDLRHHLSVIQALNAANDYSALDTYLSEYAQVLSDESFVPLCRNVAVDAIARHYMAQAQNGGVRFTASLELPEQTGARSSDLCIVLGNLLENALEACARMKDGDPYLSVTARMVGNATVIIVENSFDGRIERHGGTYLSRKRGGGAEGIGISSVKAVAERYGGVAEFEQAGGVFTARVMLGGQ